jgi:hypothetical protein
MSRSGGQLRLSCERRPHPAYGNERKELAMRIALKLLSARPFRSGNVLLTYQPVAL